MEKNIDVVIVGGGPAGLTAAIYALRSGLSVVLIEKYMMGGQVVQSYEISNFPSYESISGVDLVLKMQHQAEKLGLELVFDEIQSVNLKNKIKEIKCQNGTYFAKSVILCMGAKARRLGLDQEERWTGRGVSYCATCDGALYRDQEVVVVGGGNSACEEAVYLSAICKKVTLLCKDESMRKATATELAMLLDTQKTRGNIEIAYCTSVQQFVGEDQLEAVKVYNSSTQQEKVIPCRAVFVAIGRVPETDCVAGQVELDDYGYIVTNRDMATNLAGVFAAGDVVQKKLRQIITACGDGAIAGSEAKHYIQCAFATQSK